MSRTLRILLGGILVVLIPALLFFQERVSESPSKTTPVTSIRETTVPQGAGRGTGGERAPLQYRIERHLESTLRNGSAESPVLDLRYRGDLHLDPCEDSSFGAGYRVSFRFETVDQGRLENVEPRILESNGPIGVFVPTDFKINKTTESRARNPDELDLAGDSLSILAFRSARDTTGEYEAEWNQIGNRIRKKKIRYIGPALQSVRVLHSFHEARLGEDGIPVRLKGMDHVRMRISNEMELEFRSVYHFVRVPAQKSPFVATPVSDPPVHPAEVDSPDPSFERVAALKMEEQLARFHDSISRFTKNPALLPAFIRDVFSESAPAEQVRFGIGVLSSLDLDSAQRALREAYQRYALRPEFQHLILNALATSEVPLRPETRDLLLSLPDTDGNAAYALGASLRMAPDDRVRAHLSGLFWGSVGEEGKVMALDAIGNSGDSSFAPLVAEALRSSSERIREKAIFATRFMPDAIKLPLLSTFSRDPSLRVARAAEEAREFSRSP